MEFTKPILGLDEFLATHDEGLMGVAFRSDDCDQTALSFQASRIAAASRKISLATLSIPMIGRSQALTFCFLILMAFTGLVTL